MQWKRHLDKFGVLGSFVAAACCLGLPAIVSVMAALGLGFIVNDAVLLPLLVVFLALSLGGLALGYREHGQRLPVAVGGISAFATFVFLFVVFVAPLVYVGIVGLVAASVLNVASRRRCSVAH